MKTTAAEIRSAFSPPGLILAMIGAGAVIGSEGYGFAQDARGRSHPIPQTGTVILGDCVRVGANCCIDRAAYRATRIGAGTKLDNLCHIAHNVQIGEDCLLTAKFCVAGVHDARQPHQGERPGRHPRSPEHL